MTRLQSESHSLLEGKCYFREHKRLGRVSPMTKPVIGEVRRIAMVVSTTEDDKVVVSSRVVF